MKQTRHGALGGALVIAVALMAPPIAAPQADLRSPNVETLELKSAVFHNTRQIRVLLPPGYRDPRNAGREYPVIYLNDGIMVFRPKAIGVEAAVYDLIGRGSIPPIIAVGIDNGASTREARDPETDRANEFLPYPDVGFGPDHSYPGEPPHPEGRLYPRFLTEEVMPLVEGRYRVARGPAHTAIGGFSYGGVAALHAALSRPDVFGMLLLESTPLWIGEHQELLRDARAARSWPAVVSIASGTAESPEAAIREKGREDVATLRAAIEAAAPGTRLRVVRAEGDTHEPSAWRRRLPGALAFLFGSEAK